MLDGPRYWLRFWGPGQALYNYSGSSTDFRIGDIYNLSASEILLGCRTVGVPYTVAKTFPAAQKFDVESGNVTVLGGFLIKVMDDLCRVLHLICRIIIMDFTTYPEKVRLGYLTNNVTRVAIDPIPADTSVNGTELMHKIILTQHPVTFCALVHESHVSDEIFTMTDILSGIFDTKCWILLLFSFIMVLSLLWVSTNLPKRVTPKHHQNNREDSMWFFFYGMMRSNFGDRLNLPQRPFLVCFFLAWTVAYIIVISMLMSRLTGLVTVTKRQSLPFQTVRDLLDAEWTIRAGLPVRNSLLHSLIATEQELGRKAEPLELSLTNLLQYASNHSREKMVLIIATDQAKLLPQYTDTRFVIAIPKVREIRTGIFWFRNDDQKLMDDFSRVYMRLSSSGILSHYIRQFEQYGLLQSSPSKRSAFLNRIPNPIDITVRAAHRPLVFSGLLPFLIFLVVGLGLSTLLFIAEISRLACKVRVVKE